MVSYLNRAPRWRTIGIAVLLMLLGLLGTFGPLPDVLGVLAHVAATVVLLLGVFFRGL